MGSKGIVNLDMIHSKDVFMKVVHEVFDDMYLRMGEICEEYYLKLASIYNQVRILPNDCDDISEQDVSILVGGYEDEQIAHKMFAKMSPPKFDTYLSHGESEIVGNLPINQDGMNVDQMFNYFTAMEQALSCKNQEKEEYNPSYSIFDEVFNGSEVKDFGVPRYDIELENAMLEASREQFQVCEPTNRNKPSLKLQRNREAIYMNLIWAFIEDMFHGCSIRARLREIHGVSLLLGDALNYDHKMLHLVSNYNGRCRGRIVYKQGRSSSTNGAYALKNSRKNLFKEGKDDALWMFPTNIEIPLVSHSYSISKIPNISLVVL
ncbi:hypothetical protein MKX03_037777 [Papaver bracteatum]|nr:hypothetical protein MKX03_037777 [Papaver bracteatum]